MSVAIDSKIKKDYSLTTVFNKDIVNLYYICRVYKLDFPAMVFLYEKYKKDLMYIFYILAGKKISIPTASKYQNMSYSSDKIFKSIQNKPLDCELTSEELIYKSEIELLLTTDMKGFYVPLEIEFQDEDC